MNDSIALNKQGEDSIIIDRLKYIIVVRVIVLKKTIKPNFLNSRVS